ncbi:MAG: hypothetical protein K0S07_1421 [Chlamydiales bacterium]|jgi:hypothetical protein|nr:hypothetical protein [Chlamydiales bacterium]
MDLAPYSSQAYHFFSDLVGDTQSIINSPEQSFRWAKITTVALRVFGVSMLSGSTLRALYQVSNLELISLGTLLGMGLGYDIARIGRNLDDLLEESDSYAGRFSLLKKLVSGQVKGEPLKKTVVIGPSILLWKWVMKAEEKQA